jgi:RecQ-mediated genome instability protein 1
LNSDITQRGIFEPSAPALPPNLSNPSVKERRLPAGQGILVQVLEVEDTSRSRWEQIESIEAEERGEKQVGRELIRDVPTEEGENGVRTSTQGQRKGKSGPHKLLLEDCKGQKVYGFESTDVPKVDTGMFIGTKLLLKGCTVARGMVLLEPGTVTVVGGKIEELHGSWVRHRKEILRKGIESYRIDDST